MIANRRWLSGTGLLLAGFFAAAVGNAALPKSAWQGMLQTKKKVNAKQQTPLPTSAPPSIPTDSLNPWETTLAQPPPIDLLKKEAQALGLSDDQMWQRLCASNTALADFGDYDWLMWCETLSKLPDPETQKKVQGFVEKKVNDLSSKKKFTADQLKDTAWLIGAEPALKQIFLGRELTLDELAMPMDPSGILLKLKSMGIGGRGTVGGTHGKFTGLPEGLIGKTGSGQGTGIKGGKGGIQSQENPDTGTGGGSGGKPGLGGAKVGDKGVSTGDCVKNWETAAEQLGKGGGGKSGGGQSGGGGFDGSNAPTQGGAKGTPAEAKFGGKCYGLDLGKVFDYAGVLPDSGPTTGPQDSSKTPAPSDPHPLPGPGHAQAGGAKPSKTFNPDSDNVNPCSDTATNFAQCISAGSQSEIDMLQGKLATCQESKGPGSDMKAGGEGCGAGSGIPCGSGGTSEGGSIPPPKPIGAKGSGDPCDGLSGTCVQYLQSLQGKPVDFDPNAGHPCASAGKALIFPVQTLWTDPSPELEKAGTATTAGEEAGQAAKEAASSAAEKAEGAAMDNGAAGQKATGVSKETQNGKARTGGTK